MGLELVLQSGTTSLLLLFPAALLLGALHGLEPGHAKGLMAAFVVAVRGTPRQAVLLGLSAALSHTLIVWLVALVGFAWGERLLNGDGQSYFVLASGIVVFAVGVWTASRAWLDRPGTAAHRHGHGHHVHHHDHDHHHHAHAHDHDHHDHHDHAHHDHGHAAADDETHTRVHAADVDRMFAGRRATTAQVLLFGFGSGMVPCSAAVAVLLLCLQQQQILVGIGLVGAFTAGLAGILVAAGLFAATGLSAAAARSLRLEPLLRRAPLASGLVLTIVGLVMIDGALDRLGL